MNSAPTIDILDLYGSGVMSQKPVTIERLESFASRVRSTWLGDKVRLVVEDLDGAPSVIFKIQTNDPRSGKEVEMANMRSFRKPQSDFEILDAVHDLMRDGVAQLFDDGFMFDDHRPYATPIFE